MTQRENRFNKIIEETLRGLFWLIVIFALLGFLSSCSEDVVEPKLPTEYIFTIEKDCESCKMAYRVSSQQTVWLNEKLAYRTATDTAYAGDTLNLTVINIAGGINNNILYPIEGLLTIQSIDTTYEINLSGSNYKQIKHVLR